MAVLTLTHAHAMQAQPLYIAVFVSSMAFPALASIFKERIFADAKEKLGGKTLDLVRTMATVLTHLVQPLSACLQGHLVLAIVQPI